jgi:hypothetical protein
MLGFREVCLALAIKKKKKKKKEISKSNPIQINNSNPYLCFLMLMSS